MWIFIAPLIPLIGVAHCELTKTLYLIITKVSAYCHATTEPAWVRGSHSK